MIDWHVEKFRSAAISLQSNVNTPRLNYNDKMFVFIGYFHHVCTSALNFRFNLKLLLEKFDSLRLPTLTESDKEIEIA